MTSVLTQVKKEYELNKISYYTDFVITPLIIMGDIYYLTKHYKLNILIVVYFLMGLAFFGAAIEYGIHRLVFHGKNKKIRKAHLMHHKYPQLKIGTPYYFIAFVICIIHVVLIISTGKRFGISFAAGIVFGYLWYILIHHLIHNINNEKIRILNYFKREHRYHHEHRKLNYCVSQPFWNNVYQISYNFITLFL